jgi:CRISPR-associated protein (TIGR02710 family)
MQQDERPSRPRAIQRFAELDQVAFEQALTAAESRLRASTAREEALRVYEADVRPLEMERLWRAAVERGEVLDLLFVTVGAQATSPTHAVVASPAGFVVLLHTNEAKGSADQTVEAMGLDASRAALECIGDGKSPARLYQAIHDCWIKRGRPARVGIDITGGFKTMSAAAAAAGFVLPRGRTFYIDTEQIKVGDERFWARSRRLEIENPFEVFGDIKRATARELLKTRRYAAAASAYEALWSDGAGQRADRARSLLATAYDARQKLDFAAAEKNLGELCAWLDTMGLDPIAREDPLRGHRDAFEANLEGVRALQRVVGAQIAGSKEDPARTLKVLLSDDCRDFGAMLLAAAELRKDEPDIAALLAYRCLELVPQRRLAIRGGVDPSEVDWQTLADKSGRSLADLVAAYNQQRRQSRLKLGCLDEAALPREVASATAYALLAVAFPDDVTESMTEDKFAGIGSSRNNSLLAHGVQQVKVTSVKTMREKARTLFDKMLTIEGMSADQQEALMRRHAFIDIE